MLKAFTYQEQPTKTARFVSAGVNNVDNYKCIELIKRNTLYQ